MKLTVTEAIYPSRFIKYAKGHLIMFISDIDDDAYSHFVWDPINGNQ